MPAVSQRINGDIQILRGLSVLTILVGHNYLRFVYDPLVSLLTYVATWIGVDIFFCISGYVITTSFIAQYVRMQETDVDNRTINVFLFWLRRIFRIWPAAWFWAIGVVLAQLIFDANNDPNFAKDLISSSWAALLQINNFHQFSYIAAHGHWTHGGIFWSLSLEEQFYILFPLAFTFLSKRVFVILLLLIAVPQMLFERNDVTNSFLYFFRTDALCAGVLLAMFRNYVLNKNGKLASLIDWAAQQTVVRYIFVPFVFCSILVLPTGFIMFRYYTGMIAVLAAILVFIASADQDSIVPFRRIRPALLWVGSRSYSIYLCQIPYMAFMYWCIRGNNNVIANNIPVKIVIALGVFVVAEASYQFVEKPFLAIGHRVSKRWGAAASPDSKTDPEGTSTTGQPNLARTG